MENEAENWGSGTIVTLPRQSYEFVKDNIFTYDYLVKSKYVCVRRAVDGVHRGILVKVLGKCTDADIIIKGGEPFLKNEKIAGFNYDKYYGYRIPSALELQEVLDIIRRDRTLQADFKKASMPIHLDSTFWVRDTKRKYFFKKQLQYYDACSGECMTACDGDTHWHLSVVYFYKSEIIW